MCDIQIIQVIGNNPDLSSITVYGTIEDCFANVEGQRLHVQVGCTPETIIGFNPQDEFLGTFVDADELFIDLDGNWYAVFNNPEICRCGRQIVVKVSCETNEDCVATLVVDSLPCVECPDIFNLSDVGDDVVPSPVPTCNPDGTATVTLTRQVENDTSMAVLFQIIPGHPDGVIEAGGTAAFSPGESGSVSATIRYPTLSTPQPYIVILDTAGEPLGCPPVPIEVAQMPSCCPDIEINSIEIRECLVIVKIEPTSLPEGCTFIWDFDADNPDSQQEYGDIGQRNHTYAQPGDYRIVVRVSCGECLNEAETEIEIRACQSDDDCSWWDPRCWDWCAILRVMLIVSMAAASFLWFVVACAPGGAALVKVAIAASAAAVVLVGVWWALCGDQCDWLLISWQVPLIIGIVALFLAPCSCTWLLWAGLGLVLLAMVDFFLWLDKCEPSRCKIVQELLFVFATGAVTALTSVANYAPCGNDTLADWVAYTAAALAAIEVIGCGED
ncbi:MAG: hypothetical protein CL608_28715 [Anaerolineaceae bacterium]|nr:hypothetical protein [Anaerolineaceae bacterium]